MDTRNLKNPRKNNDFSMDEGIWDTIKGAAQGAFNAIIPGAKAATPDNSSSTSQSTSTASQASNPGGMTIGGKPVGPIKGFKAKELPSDVGEPTGRMLPGYEGDWYEYQSGSGSVWMNSGSYEVAQDKTKDSLNKMANGPDGWQYDPADLTPGQLAKNKQYAGKVLANKKEFLNLVKQGSQDDTADPNSNVKSTLMYNVSGNPVPRQKGAQVTKPDAMNDPKYNKSQTTKDVNDDEVNESTSASPSADIRRVLENLNQIHQSNVNNIDKIDKRYIAESTTTNQIAQMRALIDKI